MAADLLLIGDPVCVWGCECVCGYVRVHERERMNDKSIQEGEIFPLKSVPKAFEFSSGVKREE